ncbi:hypothetical protein PybrP1_008000, partial [[Pythium] brassicae (nom. inval.)]
TIQVFIRIRPLIDRETSQERTAGVHSIRATDAKTIEVRTAESSIKCSYDAVFDHSFSQEQTDVSRYRPGLQKSSAGIIPRAIKDIFAAVVHKEAAQQSMVVYCSFAQIYNEQIFDLLRDSAMQTPLEVHEDRKNGIYVDGLSEYAVQSVNDCLTLLQCGEQHRAVRSTHMNQVSSRSHSVFQLLLEQRKTDGSREVDPAYVERLESELEQLREVVRLPRGTPGTSGSNNNNDSEEHDDSDLRARLVKTLSENADLKRQADAQQPSSSTRPPSAGGEKKSVVGWSSVLQRPSRSNQHHEAPGGPRPLTAHGRFDGTPRALLPLQDAPALATDSPDEREVPNEAIFNTQFTTAGRMFLTKAKKNRALQVDRRTKGFELGLAQQSVLIDPITARHYRVLLVDPDMQRREDLADGLEQFFEVLVAPSNERAFALLNMFKVDFVLLRASFGHDNSAASSPTLAFLRGLKDKFVHTPVSLTVPRMSGARTSDDEMHKLLERALNHGACGFFEDGVRVPALVERLGKLLHSLVVAQTELAQCQGIGSRAQNAVGDDVARPLQAIKKRGTAVNLVWRPATSKPDSVTYDQRRMMLELSLSQRKQCLLQRQALTEALDGPHSVLGVELSLSTSASTGLLGLASPAPSLRRSDSSSAPAPRSPGGGGFCPERRRLAKMIPPLPSQQEISKHIYAKPHEIQQKIQSHLYGQLHASKHDVIPQDPLLHHCVAIDPQSVSQAAPGGKRLLVAKAFLLFQEKRYDEALRQATRAIKMESNNLVKLAYLLRGTLFDICGQYARAEREFRTALTLDPELHQAHFNLSVSLLKLGNDSAALREISLALHGDPANAQYLRNRALIYRRMGNFALAQSEYAKLEPLPGAALARANALSPPAAGAFAKAASAAALVVESSADPPCKARSCVGDVEDGLFDRLFGKPTEDKLALVCPPKERSPEMVACVAARLQAVLVFQDFPAHVLRCVAELVEYEVVACGKRFLLAEDHPQSFYVVLSGKLSVRRKFGDFMSSVTTHHIDAGATFGCAGHAVSASTQLIADEITEVGILWPDAYDASVRSYFAEKNSEVFRFLQQFKALRHFSTSELGHLIGISEHKRFRKGETILEQNEVPKYLCILWKGSCQMYQDFEKPPLSSCRNDADAAGSDGDANSDADGTDSNGGRGVSGQQLTRRQSRAKARHARDAEAGGEGKTRVLPFHRFIAKPGWPLAFEAIDMRRSKSRKHAGGRRNALSGSSAGQVGIASQHLLNVVKAPAAAIPERLKGVDKHALIRTLVAPAIFGESAFRDQEHQRSQCSIVADCIVEMLLFDHLRLQEMDLAPEVVREMSESAPKCLDERQVVRRKAEKESWNEYKNLRLLEVSKSRWPEAKKHLRLLSNGCSIMLAGRPAAPRKEGG